MVAVILSCDTNENLNRVADPETKPGVAMRNFRQLEENLYKVMAIPLTGFPLVGIVQSVRVRLPDDGVATKVSGSSLLSTAVLVSAFCERMVFHEVTLAPNKRKFLQNVNIFGSVQEFSEPARTDFTQRLARAFWQRNPTEDEVRTVVDMMGDIEKGATNKTQLLVDVLLAGCTAVGSSLDSLTI